MSRKSILIWAMAIGTLSSCMSNEDMYDPEKIAAMKVAKYEAAFVQKYGKVDPKQDWGFGEAATKAVTRTYDTGANNWKNTWIVPYPVKETEKIDVIAEFSKKEEGTESVQPGLTDFFVLQVYKNPSSYTAKDGTTKVEICKYMCDFNYNGGDTFANNGQIIVRGVEREGQNGQSQEAIALMVNESPNGYFGYKATNGENSIWNDHYLIKEINGNYYVGFDFESTAELTQNDINNKVNKDDKIVPRDYIFNDVIFKIVPARAYHKDIRRIMAEDLATNEGGDFDFNDVVFDAKVYKKQKEDNSGVSAYADITLLAAGGTLPLYIGQKSPKYEVHNLFKVEQTRMVNTEEGKEKEFTPIPITVELVNVPRKDAWNLEEGHPTWNDIPIYVGDSDKPLTAAKGGVPAKLCCPDYYRWSDERISIEEKFKGFANAVTSGKQWYESGDPGWQQ